MGHSLKHVSRPPSWISKLDLTAERNGDGAQRRCRQRPVMCVCGSRRADVTATGHWRHRWCHRHIRRRRRRWRDRRRSFRQPVVGAVEQYSVSRWTEALAVLLNRNTHPPRLGKTTHIVTSTPSIPGGPPWLCFYRTTLCQRGIML